MMTKIKWRMAKLPTPDELALLIDKGVLNKDEAREILFSLETDEDRDKASLQEEIKFLRELVTKLSKRTEIVKQIEYIQKPYIRYEWYEPYKFYCVNNNQLYSTSGTTTATTAYNLTSGATTAQQMMSVSHSSEPDFTAIKTF